MKTCHKCRREYDDTWKVCLHCGIPLSDNLEIRLARLESQAKDMLAEIDAIRKGAPPAARPAVKDRQEAILPALKEDTETRIGKYLLNKIGIVSVVAGVSFFLAYAFKYLTPLMKICIGYLISAAMAAAGTVTGRNEKYKWYGRGLICGGWVLAYFTTYAMYHVKATRIMESQTLDLVLVAILVVAMLTNMASYRSQGLVILAMLLGYVTAGISRHAPFAFLYITILAAVAGTLLVTMNWRTAAAFSLLGTYLTHLFWLIPRRIEPAASAEFWTSIGFLTAYWAIYNAVSLLVRTKDEREDRISGAFILANSLAFGLMCFMLVKAYHPAWRPHFALTAAGVLLALGVLSEFTKGRAAAKSAFLVSALAFITISLRFTLGRTPAYFIWLWEIPALLAAGFYFKSVFYRFGAWVLSVVMLLGALVSFGATGEMVVFRGKEMPLTLFLYLTAVICFYLARYVYTTWSVQPDCETAETRLSGVYTIPATVILLGVSYYEVQASLVTLTWSASALFLFMIGFFAKDRIFRYSAIGVVAVSLFRGVTVDLAGIDTAYRIILFICLGLVLLGVSFWYARMSGAARDGKVAGGQAMRLAALATVPLVTLLVLAAAYRYPSDFRRKVELDAKEVEITARFMAGNALSNEDVAFLRERKFRNLEKTLCALPLGRNSVHVDMYVRAIAMGVESKEVYRNLARYYGQNDRKSDALEMYEKGIALDPEIKQWDTRDMVRSAAKLYKDTGNYRKAAVYYEKYLAFSRNVPDLCELAVCYKNLGDYGKALERLNEAIRMDQRGSYAEEIRSLKNEIYGGKDAAGERSSPGKRK